MGSPSAAARRAIAKSTLLRRVVKSDPAQELIRSQRAARAVKQTRAFATGQIRGSQLPRGYDLREYPDVRVVVRHKTRDVDMLNEIFGGTSGQQAYALPDGVAALPASPRVLDLGGNVGLFALYARAAWGAGDVLSFEPDPTNFPVVEQARAANPSPGFRWEAVEAAVSNKPGTLQFAAGLASNSHIVEGDEEGAIDVPVVDIFDYDHNVDLVKIDIEGGEWSILGDPRFAGFGAQRLVMEWHDHLCPDADPHAAVLRLLQAAGYDVVVDHPADHLRNGVVWAQRR